MKDTSVARVRWSAVTAAIVAPVLALTLAPGAAFAAASDHTLAAGDGWSVTTAPGGYLVTYDLDEPLPIVSDAPTLLVDGQEVGLALESADGRSLSIVTADPAVADAHSVTKGWASGDAEKAAESPAVEATEEEPNDTLDAQMRRLAPLVATEDPSDPGQYTVTEAEYDFGDRAVALAGIGGIRGEMTGKMYLTNAAGERPTIVLLHGRHSSCSGPGANPLRWPCGPTQLNVRSYLGYEGTARALASHGYNVVSIAANAVNSNDNQLALDYGAQARGQLILDTLSMLDTANAGGRVSFDDISWPAADGTVTTVTRSLDDAFTLATTRADQPATGHGVTAASLAGRFDLSQVGIMGHSRGGEGVTSAATLNQGLENPFGIRAVLPLAPVDFGRMTLPDVPTAVFLPYCDGDVSNQQGQHMIDDARHAFGDDVLRSAVWVMGANHNFFNSVWTPGLYPAATGDDWSTSDRTSSCSTSDPTRLTAAQEYQVGVSYMTGFFRLTIGGETQFQSMFDGSVKPTTTSTSYADVRVSATQPASATTLVTDFASASTLVRTSGNASAQVCANAETATSIAPDVPYCTLRDIGTSRVPHWTPVRFGLNVPATPVTRVLWTGSTSDPAAPSTGQLRVSLPQGSRDVSGRSQLTLKTAPDRTVTAGTDFTITVIDAHGNTFSRAASAVNPLAVNRLPGGANATLNKIVLQQLTIPTAEMTGIDLTDVREVRLSAGVGADGTGAGGVYVSDLAFDTPALGETVVQTRTTVNVAPAKVEEGDGPGTAEVAVYLSRPEVVPVTGYLSLVGAGAIGPAVQRVEFEPGETCVAVTLPTAGDDVASAVPSTGYTVSATNTTNAVMGAAAFGQLIIREDDGTTGTVPPLPAFGAQGDPCAELTAARTPGELGTSADEIAPGDDVTLTATGYRAGESVRITFGDQSADEIAEADGTAEATFTTADDIALGDTAAAAVGVGSDRVQEAVVAVLAPTETSLVLGEGSSLVEGGSVTLVATVEGVETDGTVEFLDGPEGSARALGTAEVVDGVATLVLPTGLTAGDHSIAARFARTAVASASQSETLTVTITAAPVGGGTGTDDSGTDPSADGDLANTGGTWFVWALVLGLGLAAVGTTVVVARRRRPVPALED